MPEFRMTAGVARVVRIFLDDPGAGVYGFDLMQQTRLPSGTIYPILARLERARWITGEQESPRRPAAWAVIVILVAGDVASEEIRGRLDRLPFAVLRLARSRLPAGLRERVHDQEWVPELEHVLQHAELFPLTRLFTGLRFAAGLLIRAGSVAAELEPDAAAHGGGTEGRSWWRRMADRSASMLHAMIWPVREPLPVRLYVAGVITAAAAAAVAAAASATLHARDVELFVILAGCGVLAARCSPRVTGSGVYHNLTGLGSCPRPSCSRPCTR